MCVPREATKLAPYHVSHGMSMCTQANACICCILQAKTSATTLASYCASWRPWVSRRPSLASPARQQDAQCERASQIE